MLATVEEQRVELLITDFEAFRISKKTQALLTCDVLCILTGGDDEFLSEPILEKKLSEQANEISRRNLVVLYDGRVHSDVVLRATNWLEHSGKFKINILYVKTKRDAEEVKNIEDVLKEREYLDQARVEFNEIPITAESNSSDEAVEI